MATIDIKLKSYDELIFEITKLNTDKYLLEQENKQLKSILTELEEWLKETRINSSFTDELTLMEVQLKIQELKEKYK